MLISEELIKVCEANGWAVDEGEYSNGNGYVSLSQHSPLGEDFFFEVDAEDDGEFVYGVTEYANGFDADEHASMWLEFRGTRGVPNSIRDLIDDAEAIEEMLHDLSTQLIMKRRGEI